MKPTSINSPSDNAGIAVGVNTCSDQIDPRAIETAQTLRREAELSGKLADAIVMIESERARSARKEWQMVNLEKHRDELEAKIATMETNFESICAAYDENMGLYNNMQSQLSGHLETIDMLESRNKSLIERNDTLRWQRDRMAQVLVAMCGPIDSEMFWGQFDVHNPFRYLPDDMANVMKEGGFKPREGYAELKI